MILRILPEPFSVCQISSADELARIFHGAIRNKQEIHSPLTPSVQPSDSPQPDDSSQPDDSQKMNGFLPAYWFLSITPEEISLLCPSNDITFPTERQEDGWAGFYVDAVLDFSLIGILSDLTGILAEHRIPVFAQSTYNTDYLFIKQEYLKNALEVLERNGYLLAEDD